MNPGDTTPRGFLLSITTIAVLAACAVEGSRAQETKPEALPATAVQQDTATTTLKLSTRLVVLDVVVTDKKGELRTGLTQSDFHVTEDGQEQKILGFEAPAAHTLPAASPIVSTADLERRAPNAPVDILVIDEMNTRFTDTAYARYALKKYLDAQPATLVAPTMLIALSFDQFTVLKDYTQDRKAIETAIDKHMTTYPFALQRGESVTSYLAKSLGALEQVAKATAGHPGHKNVVWVGRGFPGLDLSNPGLDQNAVRSVQTGVQQAVNMLRDSRVTLYTIDPTAQSSTLVVRTDDNNPLGEIGDETGPGPFEGSVNFVALAKATGGKSFYSRNDVDREIGESIRDGVNFYTLYYRPTTEAETAGPYRKIRISFADKDLRAGFRDGYYTRDEAQPISNKGRTSYDVASAEESTMTYTGLTVSAIAKPGAAGSYVVGVPERELTWTPGGSQDTATLRLVAIAVDRKGKILKRVTENLTAKRTVDPAQTGLPAGLVRLEITLPPTAGTARVRFVVNSNTDGKLGTADLTGDQIGTGAQP